MEFKDLGLEEKDKEEQIDEKVREKLGIGLSEMRQALSESVQERAREIVEDMLNIAPMGDYEKLTEDKDEMATFLHDEAHKPEHWALSFLEVSGENLHFSFFNKAVDEGDNFIGSVFVGKSGKIRHAFAYGE
jgi:hypothetical protein